MPLPPTLWCLERVRCPFCAEGNNFKLMQSYEDEWLEELIPVLLLILRQTQDVASTFHKVTQR